MQEVKTDLKAGFKDKLNTCGMYSKYHAHQMFETPDLNCYYLP